MTVRVSALFVHPIKSCAAIAVSQLPMDECGALNDRRWMLVDANGKFLTQREFGALARVLPQLQPHGLLLRCIGHQDLHVHVHIELNAEYDVHSHAVIWESTVPVIDCGNAAAEWCSDVVGVSCRLVQISETARRKLDPKYAGSVDPFERHVALSDGAPLLVIGEASLAVLNERLLQRGSLAVAMDRFRPNIVLSGSAPHDEDTWRTVRIGGLTFGVGTPCPRCVITTIDQQSGRRASQKTGEPGGEPLRTLAGYRRQASGVMFGMNVTNATSGTVQVGDEVEIIEAR